MGWWPLQLCMVVGALSLAGCDEDPDGLAAAPVVEDPDFEDPEDDAVERGSSGKRPDAGDDEDDEDDERERGERDDDDRARNPQNGKPRPGTPEARKPPAGNPGNPAARKPGTGEPRPVAPKPAGINQVSATKWTVTRSLADQWMKNPYALGNVREAGAGWQIVGVRAKAGHWLGMKNGDIIMEANGHKLDTRPQLLSAYLDLKNDRLFRVTFVRDGQTMVHTYQVLEGGGGNAKK
jgi:hypothetical protein